MNLQWTTVLASLSLALSLASPVRAADRKPPRIRHRAVTQATAGQALEIRVKISDPSGVFDPTLYYRNVGSKDYLRATLVKGKKDYVATIPATALRTDIEYFVEAYDEMGNGPARVGTPSRPFRIRVMMATASTQTANRKVTTGTRTGHETNASHADQGTTQTGSGTQTVATKTNKNGAASTPVSDPNSASTGTLSTRLSHTVTTDTASPDTSAQKTSTQASDAAHTEAAAGVEHDDDPQGSLLPILAAGAGGVLLLAAVGGTVVAYMMLNQTSPGVVTLTVRAPPPVTSLRGGP